RLRRLLRPAADRLRLSRRYLSHVVGRHRIQWLQALVHSFHGRGATFSAAMILPNRTCTIQMVVDDAGGIDIPAGQDLFRSTDRGVTFSIVNTNPPGGLLSADSDADLDVLSVGPVTCTRCAESDLYFRQSTDHGATFSAPVVVESPAADFR